MTPPIFFLTKAQRNDVDIARWFTEVRSGRAHVTRCPPFADQLFVRHFAKALALFLFIEFREANSHMRIIIAAEGSTMAAQIYSETSVGTYDRKAN